MGSTSFNVPSLKLTSTVIGCVIALHLLTAIALVMVKTPVITIKPLEMRPPIEIQLVSRSYDNCRASDGNRRSRTY